MAYKPVRQRAHERSASYIGTLENPAGSNRGPDIDRWNKLAKVPLGSPYCASHQHAMYLAEGYELGGGWANADSYCPDLFMWGRGKGLEVFRPRRWDLVLFDWDQDGVLDHVGSVERVLALRWTRAGRFVGLVRTVEANTGPGLRGSQSDGDGVHRRWRWVNESTRFLRVAG